MDTRLPAVVAQCDHDLHDHPGWEQTPEGLGVRPAESGALAAVDCGEFGMGPAADELGALGGLREKPSEMEQVIFAEAIWRAFAQCFLTHDEAVNAIRDHGHGLLHNNKIGGE